MHNMQGDPEMDTYSLKPLTEWINPFVLRHLPYSTVDSNRIVDELIRVHSHELEMIDFYSNYHTPYKWTSFEENIGFQISLLARCFTPTFRTDFSPFVPATRRQEGRGILQNPSLTGQSSTGSTNSSQSSNDEDSSSDDESFLENLTASAIQEDGGDTSSKHISYHEIFPSMNQVNCGNIKPPAKKDLETYKKYAKMGSVLMTNVSTKPANPKKLLQNRHKRSINLTSLSNYSDNDCWQFKPPTVKKESIEIYEKYVETPLRISQTEDATSNADFDIICNYISSLNH